MRRDAHPWLPGWRSTLLVAALVAAVPGSSGAVLAAEPGWPVAGEGFHEHTLREYRDPAGMPASETLRLLHEHALREHREVTPVPDPHVLLHQHTLRENSGV